MFLCSTESSDRRTKTITLEIIFDGDCTSLSKLNRTQLNIIIHDILEAANFTTNGGNLRCGSVIVIFTFIVAESITLNELKHGVHLAMTSEPPTFDRVQYTYVSSDEKKSNAMESKGSSGLSEADKIIIICICIGVGFLFVILILFVIYTCNRRKYARKFVLGDTPLQTSFEDFTLQKIDRSMPYYHDHGLILPQDLPTDDTMKPKSIIANGNKSNGASMPHGFSGSRENLMLINDMNNSNAYNGIENPSFCNTTDGSSSNASDASTELVPGRRSPLAGSNDSHTSGQSSNNSVTRQNPDHIIRDEAATAF